MAAKVPAKSILKQPKLPTRTDAVDESKAKAEKDQKNLAIALHHARRIQDQKDVQSQILQSIEFLIDVPQAKVFTREEAQVFISRVQQFQPSDLDDLAEERRIDGRCGYVLCANEPRIKTGNRPSWMASQNSTDYCSNECLRKAMYVKTQLSSIPAWEREPGQQPSIILHENDRSSAAEARETERLRRLQHAREGQEALAEERGETTASFRPQQVMKENVVEKRTVAYQPLSSIHGSSISHTAIEGHEPRSRRGKKAMGTSDSDSSDED